MVKGLIIGKFYPLHLGHQYLIETALSQVDILTIIVTGKRGQIVKPETRAGWISKLYPKAKVKLIYHDIDDNDDEQWAKKSLEWAGWRPDLVFSSDDSGIHYSELMGSKLVMVDRQRKKFPISGTKVREKPLEYLDFLHPLVRAYFVRRISIVGAESSGTTTLARELAKKFKTSWVPEFGRYYWEGKMTSKYASWDHEEFEYIASSRLAFENELAKYSNKVVFCDTDALSTYIWEEFFCKSGTDAVLQYFKKSKYDLHLVTDVDIPFEDDGVRVAEKRRDLMHKQFVELLEGQKRKYIVVSGTLEERIATASAHVKQIVDNFKIEENIL